MENTNELKTIQINYPESYSQTFAVEAPPTSPRLNRRKPRMNHSSSYSAQSWLDNEKNAVSNPKPMRMVSSQQSQPIPNRCPYRRSPPQFGGDRRAGRQPPPRRPDPSAPHLKYGLFANPRKPVILGRLTNAEPSKQNLRKKATPTDSSVRNLRRERERVQKEDAYDEPEQPSDAPLLIFRPISHRYTQKLSASDVHHLDIKPGRRPISPQLPRATVVQRTPGMRTPGS